MKLLRVIATLDPRHGGPAAGLRATTPVLAAQGHSTEFLCFDDPRAAAGFKVGGKIHAIGPVRPGYGFNPRLEPWLHAHAHSFDAIFVHGLWQYHGRAVHAALHGKQPYFVFPHGMLDPWFRRAYPLKHARKWLYWQLCERRVLQDAAAVLFTCEEERRLARRTFRPYRCVERVVAYGTAGPKDDYDAQRGAFAAVCREVAGRSFLLFLGRIHPKKGVDLLLAAYGRAAAEASVGLRRPFPALVIAGPCADAEWLKSLQAIAAKLPAPCRVHWVGMLEGDAKWGALRTAEAFVLPSHQENFGIAVAEALSVRTPVLVSDRVNIWSEIVADGAGLVEADTEEGTFRLLQRWLSLGENARLEMASAAAESFQKRYEVNRVASSLIDTIKPLVSASGHDEG